MAIVLQQLMGLSDSKWNGIEGSVEECIGLDIHSTPGLTKVHQKMKRDDGVLVDGFIKVAIALSTGYSIWFSNDSGKIWARSSSGSWTLAHTTISTGADVCVGAAEYDAQVYWATDTRLHKIAIANADDDWGADMTHDFATFGVTDADFHPMAIQDLTLFIGDGNQVAQVDTAGTFSSNVLDLRAPFRIKSMAPYEWDLLIGTYVADTVNQTELIRWDTVSPSWNTSDPIEEVGINAFIRDDNYMYVNAGRAGNLYFYNGDQLVRFKRIPGTYSTTETGQVHPESHANFQGIPVFGFSNIAGNPAKQGVYSFGSYSRDYPKVLDLSWVNSQDKTSSQEIGAILSLDMDLLMAWKDGSNFGIDIIDTANKYASAYFSTRKLFQENRHIEKTLAGVQVLYDNLPASTGVTISYSINSGAYVAMTDVDDSVLQSLKAQLSVGQIGSLQVKVAFDVSSNNAPTMEALDVIME